MNSETDLNLANVSANLATRGGPAINSENSRCTTLGYDGKSHDHDRFIFVYKIVIWDSCIFSGMFWDLSHELRVP
jgi:hypothetical protein